MPAKKSFQPVAQTRAFLAVGQQSAERRNGAESRCRRPCASNSPTSAWTPCSSTTCARPCRAKGGIGAWLPLLRCKVARHQMSKKQNARAEVSLQVIQRWAHVQPNRRHMFPEIRSWLMWPALLLDRHLAEYWSRKRHQLDNGLERYLHTKASWLCRSFALELETGLSHSGRRRR